MFGRWFKTKRSPIDLDLQWPPLPTAGFVRGRAATVADVEAGNAVFYQATEDGIPAEPHSVDVPQYAIWRNEDGSTTNTFLVQAERHVSQPDGELVFGLRTFDGQEIVALSEEVELLGSKPLA